MKDQYFGDKRDLFKFDLVLDIMAATGLRKFCYLPMLTEPDVSGHGGLVPRAANGRRPELFDFLVAERARGEPRLSRLRRFFELCPEVRYLPYRDSLDAGEYTHGQREAYFADVPDDLLRDSCVLLDPDIGLERGRADPTKYLHFDSLLGLRSRCRNAVVVVYQHLQKNAHLRLAQVGGDMARLRTCLAPALVSCIRDGDQAFYTIAQDAGLGRSAADALFCHAEKTGRLRDHVGDLLSIATTLLEVDTGPVDLSFFGSVARGEQTRESDVDVLARFARPATLRGYFAIQTLLESLLGRTVDLVTDKALRPELRDRVERDAIHAA